MFCAGLCVFALVAAFPLHEHVCHAESLCQYSHSAPVHEHACSICDFVHLAVPYVTIDGLLAVPVDVVGNTSWTETVVSFPFLPATDVTSLPQCRAPPGR